MRQCVACVRVESKRISIVEFLIICILIDEFSCLLIW